MFDCGCAIYLRVHYLAQNPFNLVGILLLTVVTETQQTVGL